jgi:predicted branched-subunit amino acid permease
MAVETIDNRSTAGEFMLGMRASVPVIVAVLPFGLLFGALAVDNGFSVFEAMLMSATVYGGASQMVGIELFGNKVAPWLIVISIFAVNFRHVLYSAVFGRRIANWPILQKAVAFFLLSDPQFAVAERKEEHDETVSFAWYFGLGAPVWLSWVAVSWLGASFRGLVADPQALGLDYLLPIYFLGLVMSFRKRPLWLPVVAASAVSSVLAFRFIGMPWQISIGALVGVAVAVAMPLEKNEAAKTDERGR